MMQQLNEILMYIDIATVYRYQKQNNLDGSTTQCKIPVSQLSNIPCRLDIKKGDDPSHEKGVNSVNELYTLFTSNVRPFRAGDNIEVLHYGKTYNFTAGEPIMYDFHQEISLSRKEWA